MRSTFILLILLVISTGAFAQKKESSGNTQDKARKEASDDKARSDAVDGKTNADEKETGKDSKQSQETRYQEGSSGVKRSIHYKFSISKSDSDPGNGIFRYNSDSPSSATYIYIDDIDLSGEDQTKWYSTWDDTTGATGRGRINVVEYEGKNINVFDIKGVFVESEGYWKVPVEYVSGSLPADGSVYYYVFERIENKDKANKKESEGPEKETAIAIAAVVAVTAAQPEVVAEQTTEPVVQPEPEPVQPAPVVEEKTEEAVVPPAQPEVVAEPKTESVVQPEPDPVQPAPVVEEKTEETVVPPAQPEVVAEPKTEPVVQPEPEPVQAVPVVHEKTEEPVVPPAQPEVVAEPKTEPVVQPEPEPVQAVPVVQEKTEEPVVQATQPEPVTEVKEQSIAQPEPIAVQEAEEKQENKVEVTTAAVAVVAATSQPGKPKAEPRTRVNQSSEAVPKSQAPAEGQVRRESQPAQSTRSSVPSQQTPANRTETTAQSTQTKQPAPARKENPVSQPTTKTTQPASQPSQPASTPQAPRPVQTSPTTQGAPVYSGYSASKRTEGSRIWHGIIETGYGIKASEYGINNYRINFISSFSLGKHFMIGLGVGYRNYADKPDKHPDWYLISKKSQIPVFLDLRFLLSKKQLTPYIALGLGGSGEKSKVDTTKYGSFINPSAGIWYRMSKNTALFAGIAYEIIEMEYARPVDNIPFRRKNNSLSLNIGIQF